MTSPRKKSRSSMKCTRFLLPTTPACEQRTNCLCLSIPMKKWQNTAAIGSCYLTRNWTGNIAFTNMKKVKLPKLKTLDDFTKEEVNWFDEMLKVLAAYNASLGTKNELPLPQYTDREMAEFSGYRELVIAKECEG